jgi:tryptophan synthase alpha chain
MARPSSAAPSARWHGAGSRYVLQAVAQFRERDAQTPVVLMGYLNPVEIHGYAAFAKAAVDAGVDGVLLVDLPPEEAGEAQQAFDAAGLALVLLASPTTSEARADKLLALARGYLYYVSFAGSPARPSAWTAMPPVPAAGAARALRAGGGWLRHQGRRQCGGDGAQADGVVVGSALVAVLAEAGSAEEAAQRAAEPSWPRCGRRWTRNGRAGAGRHRLTATCSAAGQRPALPHGSARRGDGQRPALGLHVGGCGQRRHDPAPKRTSQHGFSGGPCPARVHGRESGARLSAFAALGPP